MESKRVFKRERKKSCVKETTQSVDKKSLLRPLSERGPEKEELKSKKRSRKSTTDVEQEEKKAEEEDDVELEKYFEEQRKKFIQLKSMKIDVVFNPNGDKSPKKSPEKKQQQQQQMNDDVVSFDEQGNESIGTMSPIKPKKNT